jgi:translation initiation factor 2B subunit (eIF-2B alpha/beta/delta family)
MATVLSERVAELRAERRHGGSWMSRRAVEALAELAAEPAATSEELLERLARAGRELARSRPAMGAVAGAVGRLLATAHACAALPADELARVIRDEAQSLVASRDRAARAIAIQLAPVLTDALVVTHSHSATVREALLHTAPAHVTCTVSAPFEEGRAFAEELAGAGLHVELVDDADGPGAVAGASVLLLGADTVYRDGTVCNKVGTRALAEAASRAGVPTVVACEVIKLAPVEAADAPDSAGDRGLFDLTPPELVESFVTEEGAVRAGEVRSLVDRTPFLRDGWALLRGDR